MSHGRREDPPARRKTQRYRRKVARDCASVRGWAWRKWRAARRSPAGFLSAIELSQANPSVATLQRLANVYNTTVLEFYDLPRKPSAIMKPSMRPLLRTESGVAMELLSTGTKMLQSMLFRVPPGSGSDGSYSHSGEEFIYMLNGTLEIWLDELECHVLHEGESFWFESTRGHRWFNSGDRESVLAVDQYAADVLTSFRAPRLSFRLTTLHTFCRHEKTHGAA